MIRLHKFSNSNDLSISSEGTYTNPLRYSNPTTEEEKFYIRGQENEYFTDCTIYAKEQNGDISSYFQFALEVDGGTGPYSANQSFELSELQEIPMWIRAVIPTDIGDNVNIKIAIDYTRHEI